MKRLVMMAALLALCGTAQAGDKKHEKDREAIFEKVTEVDFEGVNVEGKLVGPSGGLVSERPPAHFNSLFDLREDFDLEMRQSVAEVK